MLIAIAGSIGAGKSTIARAVADRMNLPFHAIDDDKQMVGATHPDFDRWVAEATPFPDEFRRRVFERTLEQLIELAESHPHAIVEETFHRASIREPFFAAAADALGGLVLIEIVVDREVAMAHLAKRAQEEAGHMAGRRMFAAFEAVADPLENVDLKVENNGRLDETVEEVCRFLTGRLG